MSRPKRKKKMPLVTLDQAVRLTCSSWTRERILEATGGRKRMRLNEVMALETVEVFDLFTLASLAGHLCEGLPGAYCCKGPHYYWWCGSAELRKFRRWLARNYE